MTWWAVDVLAYVLCRMRWLKESCLPLDPDEVKRWIRHTQMPWAPGSANLERDLDWDWLNSHDSELGLVKALLGKAAEEALVSDVRGVSLMAGSVGLAARRRLPLTTLAMEAGAAHFSSTPVEMNDYLGDGCADGHVHQGASLPLDVMLHWIAGAVETLPYRSETVPSGPSAAWLSVDDERFQPEPLLLLLHLAKEGSADAEVAITAVEAACDSATAWSRLMDREPLPGRSQILTSDRLLTEKRAQLADAPEQWLITVRVEAILHAALTQRSPGLGEFVLLFNRLGDARRAFHRVQDKKTYFCTVLEQHRKMTPQLVGVELRFGELALTGRRTGGVREMRTDVFAALQGYADYTAECDSPLKATFPIGLIKTGAVPSENWRYNVRDVYGLIENLIELLDDHRELYRFVDGIDVCGLEEEAPTWLFRPGFERLAAWSRSNQRPMTFRFHAGETFWHPVHGLRSIDEFLEMQVDRTGARRRVGHGLALDWTDVSRLPKEPLHEFLDDVVWAWYKLGDHPESRDLRCALEQIAYDLVPSVFRADGLEAAGRPNLTELLLKAYYARVDRHVLLRIGMLHRDHGGRLSFKDAPPSPGRDLVERLACASLESEGVVRERVGDWAQRQSISIERLACVVSDVYPFLRERVVNRLRATESVVEACPTSNVLTGGVRGYYQHPLRYLVGQGVDVTVNSDDPSLFHAFVGEELKHVWPYLRQAEQRVVSLGRDVVGPNIDLPSLGATLAELLVFD